MSYATEKQAAFTRDKWKCRHCGIRNDLHPHHVQFRSHRGPDIRQNLLTLCCQCHDAVHACNLRLIFSDGDLREVATGSQFFDVEKCGLVFERMKGWKPK
jgi:rubredoxin